MTEPLTATEDHHRDASRTTALILDAAQALVQVRGFNGFSYADVATELHMTKAALHYHFPGKAELGAALMRRYAERFTQALQAVDAAGGGATARLEGYLRIYEGVFRADRMCLCGMLAAEYHTLPAQVRPAVLDFFDQNERWLERLLDDGLAHGDVEFAGSSRDAALLILSGLEGAMLVARTYGDIERFLTAARGILWCVLPRHRQEQPAAQ